MLDTTVAQAARVYDYLLGGSYNFPADREAATRQAAAYGGVDAVRADLRANRAFLGRVVRFLATQSEVRQFLDIGSGIPNSDNVHAVAQAITPEAHVVYVDNDPLVLVHASTLLDSTAEGATAYMNGDLRDVHNIMLRAAATLDLAQPVAVLLIAVLHLIPDEDDPFRIVSELVEAVPSGSYLVISHLTRDHEAPGVSGSPVLPGCFGQPPGTALTLRSRAEVGRFFDGLDLVPPGLVPVDEWRATSAANRVTALYAGVGRKP